MQVAKWGNSLAVRLPAIVVEALGLKEGGRDELLKRLRAFRGRLPADFRFDRDEANAR